MARGSASTFPSEFGTPSTAPRGAVIDSSVGISLNHINPSGNATISAAVTGPQTSIQSNGIGIVVENSSFVTLDSGNPNSNGAGIGRGAVGTINKNSVGAIDIENSRNVAVKGWQRLVVSWLRADSSNRRKPRLPYLPWDAMSIGPEKILARVSKVRRLES
jgi:hypothetical protein